MWAEVLNVGCVSVFYQEILIQTISHLTMHFLRLSVIRHSEVSLHEIFEIEI